MTIRLEHANITVRDIDGVIRFLQAAFPDFRIRHEESGEEGSRRVHIGSDETYIALSQAAAEAEHRRKPYQGSESSAKFREGFRVLFAGFPLLPFSVFPPVAAGGFA